MSQKCPICNSFMRKEGEEWKCSRCEKEKAEVAEIEAPVKVIAAKVAESPIAAVIENAEKESKKNPDVKKTLNEADFATLGGMKLALGKTESGEWLGYLLGFSIGERLIPHQIADKKMDELGMPENIRPSKSRKKDAFKNACVLQEKEEIFSSPTLSKKYGADARFRAVYEADQIKTPEGKIEYIIDRKIYLVDQTKSDKQKKKSDIQFDRLARITLVIENEDKPNESYHIEAEPMPQGDEKTANYLKGLIIEDWKTLLKSYTSKQVRDALRKFIRDGKGVPFTTGRGGMYFLLKQEEENIKRWVEFCQWCDTQPGSDNRVDLRVMPAVDIFGMKRNVARDVADEVQQRIKNLLEDTYKKLKEEKDEEKIIEVLEKQLASKKEDVDGLLTNYKSILKDEIEVVLKIDVARNEKVEENLSPKAKQMLRQMMNV